MTFDPAPGTQGESFIVTSENGDVYSITEIEQINFSNGATGLRNNDGGWTVIQTPKDSDGEITIAGPVSEPEQDPEPQTDDPGEPQPPRGATGPS